MGENSALARVAPAKYSFAVSCGQNIDSVRLILNSEVKRRNKSNYGDSGCARMTTPEAAPE
jgi:hypothetical protein